jgi:hypothetical protein
MQRRDATPGGSPGRTGKVFIALRLREIGGRSSFSAGRVA